MSTAMERYQGVILIRLQNAGSKSEGHYAFLVRDDDMSVVKLCREGAVPVDDPYFAPLPTCVPQCRSPGRGSSLREP